MGPFYAMKKMKFCEYGPRCKSKCLYLNKCFRFKSVPLISDQRDNTTKTRVLFSFFDPEKAEPFGQAANKAVSRYDPG